MSLTDSLFGRPLATSEERAEHIGVAAGIPIFGLDALTSAAYGPETAMALLIPLGVMGIQFIVPIISAILILLSIVSIRAFRGHYTPEEHKGLNVPGIYWHFVDVMWIVVFTTVYVL